MLSAELSLLRRMARLMPPPTFPTSAAAVVTIKRCRQVSSSTLKSDFKSVRNSDLKENAEYHAAREKQSMAEARISDIEDKLSRAEVIDISKLSGDVVRFGALVKLLDIDADKYVEYRILGPDESDINQGSISVSSPMARALIGKRVGDEVQVRAPGGTKNYEIDSVRWS